MDLASTKCPRILKELVYNIKYRRKLYKRKWRRQETETLPMTFKASEASPSDQSYLENDRPSNLTSRYVQPAELHGLLRGYWITGGINVYYLRYNIDTVTAELWNSDGSSNAMKVLAISEMNVLAELQNCLRDKWRGPSDTLHFTKVPKVLREPAIFTGYRPVNRSWNYYLLSLFRIHNETFNIWSHLVGIITIFLVLLNLSDTYGSTTNKHLWPVMTFGTCAIITSLLSTVAHLFHSKSANVHYTMFLLDYIGVTFYSYGSGVLSMYACSTKAFYEAWSQHYLPTLVVACWFSYIVLCLAKCLYGENPFNISRKLLQIGSVLILSIWLIAPLFDRYITCYMQKSCSLSSLHHITVCILLFGSQAFFFGSHLPEKLFPGKCDILGQGHQIFHILSTLTQITQIRAVIIDMESGHSDHTDPVLSHLFFYGVLLMSLSLVTFLFARKFTPSN
uniref:Uncharacterized protein n=2 Tax=Magallana gigas TaxID=29159 RepID=A0A8W8I9E2_MAGGI